MQHILIKDRGLSKVVFFHSVSTCLCIDLWKLKDCGRWYIRSLPDSFRTSVKLYLERRRREFPELYLVPISSSPIGGSWRTWILDWLPSLYIDPRPSTILPQSQYSSLIVDPIFYAFVNHASPEGYSSRRYSTNQTTYSCPGPGSMY